MGVLARVVSVVSCLLPFQDAPQTDTAARVQISRMSGEIQVWHEKAQKTEKLVEPIDLTSADRVGVPKSVIGRIAVESKLVITIKDVAVGKGHGMSIEKHGKKIVLNLYQGKILVESCETDVTVHAPRGVIVDGNSGSFLIEVDKEENTRVVPLEGKLTMKHAGGAIELPLGEFGQTRGSRTPITGKVAGLEKEIGWVSSFEGSGNIIKNPGFKNGLEHWETLSAKGNSLVKIDEKTFHSEGSSACVELPDVRLGTDTDSGKGNIPLSQSLKKALEPKTRYFLRMFYRTEGFKDEGRPGPVGVTILFDHVTGTENRFRGEFPVSEDGWRCARFFFEAGGEDMRLLLVHQYMRRVKGKIWFDDLFLAPVVK